MLFFDAHCDTVMKSLDEGLDFVKGGSAHIDLPRLLAAGGRLQVFAVFMAPGDYPPGGDFVPYAERALATIRGWAEASGGRLRLAMTAADVRAAFAPATPSSDSPPPAYALPALEGADCLEGRADNLPRWFEAGVRHIIPAWEDNAFSGTVMGHGGPLTEEGARLVEACEALGVMVDVSHLSDDAFWQVHQVSKKPYIASHSACRALCPHPRNPTDAMIRAIAGRGGVMGIAVGSEFLDPNWAAAARPAYLRYRPLIRAAKDSETREQLKAEREAQIAGIPPAGLDWFGRHVQHAIEVGGEDCVGLGGDLDGVSNMPAGITGVESYPILAWALRRSGLTEAQVEKVLWRNFARVYEEILPRS